jgi:uncharacterized protein (DUF2252 family)
MDAVRQIKDFNAGRDPQRLAMKYDKMRSDVFAFFRGSCHLFYDRLSPQGLSKHFPLVWVCGDLQLENFGSYKGDNRLVYFDINDFDEAALAPASWDLVRMLCSIRIGTDGFTASAVDAQTLCTSFLESYSSALATGKSYWVERDTADGPVRDLLTGLRNRSRAEFLDSRTEIKDKKRAIRVEGKKALSVSSVQRATIMNFMATFAQSHSNPDFYKVIDVARRIAGTGSLGLDRFTILVQGKGSPHGNYLLDLRFSAPSCLLPHLKVKQPRWATEAHRVVALQERVQAVPMAFLQPVRLGEAAYVLRALQPSEDRVATARLTTGHLKELINTMGKIVAWAHLRSASRQGAATLDELIDFGQRKKWQEKLLKKSRVFTQQVHADWTTFNAAYDDGAFGGK